MEMVGVGSGIVECARIGAMIERHGELFLQRVYTEREIRFCHCRPRALQWFAAHWSAKEAVMRALGTGPFEGVAWSDFEIRVDPRGRATVHVGGPAKHVVRRRGVADVWLSMAHCRTHATAHATAVGRSGPTPEA